MWLGVAEHVRIREKGSAFDGGAGGLRKRSTLHLILLTKCWAARLDEPDLDPLLCPTTDRNRPDLGRLPVGRSASRPTPTSSPYCI